MVDFAEVTRVAKEQGQLRAEYAALCEQRFKAVSDALESRVKTGGGTVTIKPQGSEPVNGVMLAEVSFRFPNELTFDQAVTGMSSWFGVKAFPDHPMSMFEVTFAGGDFVTSSPAEAVDKILSSLMQVMKQTSAAYMGR